MRGSWRCLGCIFSGLRVLGLLGSVLGGSWALLGCSWGVLGALWAPNPNKNEGAPFLEPILGSVLGGLGASWALLKVSWRVFLPLLERLGRVLTTNWKKTRFLQSRKRFFNLFDAFETLKFDVSPRREPYFSKNHFFVFFRILCCSGLSWGPCWPHFGGLGEVLEPSWAILDLVKAGQARSGQVRSGQVKSG